MKTLSRIILAIAVLLSGFTWYKLPRYLADRELRTYGTQKDINAIGPERHALLINEYRKTVAQGIGGFGFLATLLISVLTLRSSERGRLADRFASGIDHLGAVRRDEDKAASEVRIGGVAELESVGDRDEDEKRRIKSSFASYIRHFADWGGAVRSKFEPAVWRMKEIQAMMEVLGRWGISKTETSEVRLADVDFRNLKMSYGANLDNLIASRSHFDYAELDGVTLRNAELGNVRFRGAKLRGVDFRGAKLRNCDFAGGLAAEKSWGISPGSWKFGWNSPSEDAEMTGAIMKGIDLTTTRMTQKQFDSVVKDSRTKSPANYV